MRIAEADTLYLFLREAASGSIGDAEPPLAAAVNQMGCGAEIGLQLRVALHCGQGAGGAAIAVPAHQLVYCGVFSKLLEAGRQNQQLGIVGQGHTGAVNGLVAQPGALEFGRVQPHYAFVYFAVQLHKIHLLRKCRRLAKTLVIVAHEEPFGDHTAVFRCPYSEDINYREVAQEMGSGILQCIAHRAAGMPHKALHPIAGSQKVALANKVGAAHSHENILCVVGHTHHLVRHDLAYGEYQIEAGIQQQAIDLGLDAVVHLPF